MLCRFKILERGYWILFFLFVVERKVLCGYKKITFNLYNCAVLPRVPKAYEQISNNFLRGFVIVCIDRAKLTKRFIVTIEKSFKGQRIICSQKSCQSFVCKGLIHAGCFLFRQN